MDRLKIWFTDFWPEFQVEDFISPILKNNFEVILDKDNPDVLFFSMFGKQEQLKYNCKKIFFTGENVRGYPYGEDMRKRIETSLSSADYTITFDPHSDTNYNLPLWQVFLLLKPELKDRLYNRINYNEFDCFCSFTVSNSVNFLRNGMFNGLSQYKRVNSYGKHLNNDRGLQLASQGRYWRDVKDEFFSAIKHKFSICYENTSYPGYCTEKLMDGYLGGSLPIYWGDPRAKAWFNETSFINAMKHGTNIIEYIKFLDNNEEEFNKIYKENIFTDEQKLKLDSNLSNFETWLINAVKN